MNNIFEKAFFGKPYKTRNGRKAIYQHGDDEFHHLFLSSCDIFVDSCGYINCKELPSGLDIVSEWEEPIDEDELNSLATEYADEHSDYGYYEEEFDKLYNAYKAGYKQALEGKQ